MKLKSQPRLPFRKEVDHRVDLPYDCIVFDIVSHCVKQLVLEGYTPAELTLLSDHDIKLDYSRGYYDDVDLIANFTTLESDESWNRREQAYIKRMDDYDLWLVENADAIAVEIAERERQQKINFRNKTQAKVDKLADQLAAEHKKLSAL